MVEPTRMGGDKYSTSQSAAIKEKTRITKNLELMGPGDTKTIEKLEHIEEKVAQLPVPTDYCSPTFLQKTTPKIKMHAEKITTNTKGVDTYLSGEDNSLYETFMSSISSALTMV